MERISSNERILKENHFFKVEGKYALTFCKNDSNTLLSFLRNEAKI
jgi:hypothetical protein